MVNQNLSSGSLGAADTLTPWIGLILMSTYDASIVKIHSVQMYFAFLVDFVWHEFNLRMMYSYHAVWIILYWTMSSIFVCLSNMILMLTWNQQEGKSKKGRKVYMTISKFHSEGDMMAGN